MILCAVGADIGGTATKLVAMDRSGRVHLRDRFPTPVDGQPEAIVANICSATAAFLERAVTAGLDVRGVAFSVPQFFEEEDWAQRHAYNLPSLESFAMRPPLMRAFGPSVRMIHDLDAGGLAEYRFGQGRGHDRMLLMAIGTGIGTSLVTRQDGLVRYGRWGSSGDAGMVNVEPSGETACSCGGRGCLEALASAPAIRRRALREVDAGRQTLLRGVRDRSGDIQARDVSDAAHAGDQVAREILDEVGSRVGAALTSLLHIFGPDVIVLGGGVARAGPLLVESVRRTMKRLASPAYLDRLRGIEISGLGDDGPAMGAAGVALFGDTRWGGP